MSQINVGADTVHNVVQMAETHWGVTPTAEIIAGECIKTMSATRACEVMQHITKLS
jgi:hypothetical protein